MNLYRNLSEYKINKTLKYSNIYINSFLEKYQKI